MAAGFLPLSRKEMRSAGIERPDFVYVSGDAYVDHPSFGTAVISRVLESKGYSVCLICQPDWKDPASIREYGEPRLGFMVSSGNMDSMVNHYTASKKRRSEDAYSPGGKTGRRPDHAVIAYCNLIRSAYKDAPIIIGGIEASLSRMGHYDYWSDSVKRSVLLESGADILSYGMGELSIIAIADALNDGIKVRDITYVPGTVFKSRREEDREGCIELPSFDEIKTDKKRFAESFRIQYENTDPFTAKKLSEAYGGSMHVIQNPPSRPLTQEEFDGIYSLPFTGRYHPSYEKAGGVPALTEVRFSITSSRGCFGECSFCSLAFHEGRIVQARSHASIIKEAENMTRAEDFKGYIHDVGGPTAQFRGPACSKQMTKGACRGKRCLFPKPCGNLRVDHSDYLKLLRKLRELKGVKKVFVRSGIRYDYLMADRDNEFLRELCRYHISGQLRVAPEHVSDRVLELMGKPQSEVYDRFLARFSAVNAKTGKEQYVVPYFISSHPGSTLADAIMLAEYLNRNHINPEQVQEFYPTPSTASTCMYYTGYDPFTMKKVYVAKSADERAMQRALMQFKKPANYDHVKRALLKEDREDLIGFGKDCLIPPRRPAGKKAAGVRERTYKKTGPKANGKRRGQR